MKSNITSRFFTGVVQAVLLLCVAGGLSGQTTLFTVEATAQTSDLGYVQGVTYEFTLTMNDNFSNANAYGATADARNNWWREELTDNDQLFLDVSSPSLTGSYQRPTATPGDPSSEIKTDENYDSLTLTINSNSKTPSGLTTPNGTPIHMFYAQGMESDDWTLTADSTVYEVGDYFSSFNGTYSIGYGIFFMNSPADGYVQFSVTGNNVTVSHVSAVPEPSTYAAILGGLAISTAGIRRRRRSSPVAEVG